MLAFGRDAERRVWLIHDCRTLYIDRNGNGDLTEPDQRVAANIQDTSAVRFEAGDLRTGKITQKRLLIEVLNVEWMALAKRIGLHPCAT